MAKKLISYDDEQAGDAALPEPVNEVLRATYVRSPSDLEPAYEAYGDQLARPTHPGLVAIGDSITDNNHASTTWSGASYSRTSAYRADGYLAGAMVVARQRCSWVEKGISGESTGAMLARFDTDVTALNPHIVIEAGGTNDMRSGKTVAELIANKRAMWEKAWAIGAKVISTTVPPAADSGDPVRRNVQEANNWLREYARSNPQNFILVDWYPDMVDPLTGGVKTSVMDAAGVHPNSLGALNLSAKFAEAIDRFLPSTFDPLPNDNLNDLGNLMSTPLLTGATGGKSGNYTGTNATGWFGSTAATSAVGSVVARPDGLGQWQQITATGTGRSRVSRNIRSEFTVGDIIQGTVEFETDAADWADGAVDIQMACLQADGTTAVHSASSFSNGADATALGRYPAGVLQTPPIVIPTGTTSVQVSLILNNGGTARFGRVAVRKLT